jgi:hypothetical protein
MRIFEIVDTQWSSGHILRGVKQLGSGENAEVFINPYDPGIVVRREKDFKHWEDNGFLQWALVISRHQDANPYLPRIYRVQTRKSSEDPNFRQHTYEIERLQSVEDDDNQRWDPEIIKSIGRKTIKNWNKAIEPKIKDLSSYQILVKIAEIIRDSVEHDTYHQTIRDPLLIRAIELMTAANANLMQTRVVHGRYDIHSENIMLRPTNVGPQLVITDPLH